MPCTLKPTVRLAVHIRRGVIIGMYATGNGKENTNPADFDWFDYEAKDFKLER
jgi:hypothetical protein